MSHDVRQLDFNLLKAFDALFDERSVTKAALRLYVTQPAVSTMLQRLRDYFEDPLFIRGQRGIYPTLRAIELAPVVKNILYEISTLLKPHTFDPLQANLTLKIAATDYATKVVLVPFIAALRQYAPQVRVSVVSIANQQLFHQLEIGEVDFALVTPDTMHADLHHHDLFKEHYVCLVHEQHPLARQQDLSLDDFCNTAHALVSHDGGQFYGITDQQLKQVQRARSVLLSVNNFLILPDILAATDLIAVVPSRLVQGLQQFKVFNPPIFIPGFTKTLVWHERNQRDLAQHWLRELLIKTINQAA